MSPAPSGERQFASFRLARVLDEAVRTEERDELHVVPAVNVKISTAWRTALTPDVVVLSTPPVGVSFAPKAIGLVAEIWSPGSSRAERDTKLAGYAVAGVSFLWMFDEGRLTTYRLVNGLYEVSQTAEPGSEVTITAAPVPVTLDVAQLSR